MRHLVVVLAFFYVGCGVKGNPLPPEEPIMIGRGSPEKDGVVSELTKKAKLKAQQDEEARIQRQRQSGMMGETKDDKSK